MASARPHELDDARLAALLAPITLSASSPRRRFENWGKTHRCTPARVFVPTTDFECELVLELARRHRTTVRAAGAGHSPSDLACTTGYLIRTDNLNRLLEVSAFTSLHPRGSYPLLHRARSSWDRGPYLTWPSPQYWPLRHAPCSRDFPLS